MTGTNEEESGQHSDNLSNLGTAPTGAEIAEICLI